MYRRILSFLATAAVALAPVPSIAADQAAVPSAASQAVSLPTMGAVAAFYNQWKTEPMWFRGAVPTAGANQLPAILRRSTFDGLGSGPQIAAQVEAAIRQAASGAPADIMAAERTLSAAWVLYVQTIRRPTPGMIYAYDVLKPQGTRPDQILLTAAAAPSLEQHIQQVSRVNPIYASIRDAAWNEAQATGQSAPDARVLANLARARSIPDSGRFIVVDSASQRLTMYENGQPVDSMKVIVGTPDMATPLIASIMYYITYNPYWNAPDHLVRGPIAKKTLAGGMKYFREKMGYEVMADWTRDSATIPAESVDWKAVAAGKTKLRIRQKPGPENFMGELKFPFPNPEDIYLHDTPAKQLFDQSNRALSNGCVRVEDAKRLGRFLLGREPVAPGSEPEIQVQIPRGVPIYLTYLTVQPKDGKLTYLKDVYGWDRLGASQQVAAR
jgi:murein L,D-transpeptidase YcbB/YkuD